MVTLKLLALKSPYLFFTGIAILSYQSNARVISKTLNAYQSVYYDFHNHMSYLVWP